MARTSRILLEEPGELKSEGGGEERGGLFAVLIDVRCETAFADHLRLSHPLPAPSSNFVSAPSQSLHFPPRRRRHQVQLNQSRNIQPGGKLKKELKVGRHCTERISETRAILRFFPPF